MKNFFFVACLLMSFVLNAEVKFEKLWEYSSGNSMLPAWVGANTERSMAYYNGKLYVVSRNGGNKLLEISQEGMLERTITLNNLANGVLKGNNIGITSDGQILVGSAGQQGFSIQKIDLATGNAVDFLTSPSSNVKNGGRIDGWGVYGTMEKGYIAVPVSYEAGTTNGGNEVMIFNIEQGKVINPTAPIVVANTNGVAATATMAGESSFFVLSANFVPKRIVLDGSWKVADDQFPVNLFTPQCAGGAYFEYLGKEYFVSAGGNQYGALQVFDVSGGYSAAAEVFTAPAIGNVDNVFSKTNPVCVNVQSDGAYVYVLSTNNGIVAYRMYDSEVFAGTYSVGQGGDYPTLSAAVNDIANRKQEIKGDITLEVVSDIEETTNLSLSVDISPYKLTIRPDGETLRTVTFSSPTANAGVSGAIVIGGTLTDVTPVSVANIEFNGSPNGKNGRYLKLATNKTTHPKSHLITFYGGVNNVALRNCIIEHNANVEGIANNYAICMRRSGDNWPQNITIENNEISNVSGISSDAISPDLMNSGGDGLMKGIVIKNNIIIAHARGIIVGYVDGLVVSGNKFNLSQSADGMTTAALLGFGNVSGKIIVENNEFTSFASANTTSSGGCKAIVTEGASAEWIVYNNFFGGFNKTSASGSSVFGCIDCNTPSVVYQNTFVLNNLENAPSQYYAVFSKDNALKALKNNLFVSYEQQTPNSFLQKVGAGISDNNVFWFEEGNANCSISDAGQDLQAHIQNSGNDQNSKFGKVEFVDILSGNYHIAKPSIGSEWLTVARLAEVEYDIDNDLRSEITYAGADEPTIPVIVVPTALRATEVTENSFVANWSEISGATSYKLNVYTKNPLTYVCEEKEVTDNFAEITGLSAATNYYYTVSAVDNQFESALSNEVLVRTKNHTVPGEGHTLDSFVESPYFGEQVLAFDFMPDVKVEINAPSVSDFDASKPTAIVLYGLPNGNSTDWTIGKQPSDGDDWHYQIQHIGAQTRFVREQNPDFNLVTVYLEAKSQSWGNWRSTVDDADSKIKELTEYILNIFEGYNPFIVLNGHSGGGNFPFGFMDAVNEIPDYIKKIAFLDSNYNWENERYGKKLVDWLEKSPEHHLVVICYDDLNALLDGKPIVSATGGTWYRSQVMQKYLQDNLGWEWTKKEDDNMIEHATVNGQIQFLMKKNPNREILHTVLVEKNGYIHSVLFGTPLSGQGYEFMGNAVYSSWIQTATVYPHILRIPPRAKDAISGSAFVAKVEKMSLEAREMEIYKEVSRGNIPNAFRQTTLITETMTDANGVEHAVELSVIPDYVAIGSDEDFIRMPMLPETAQRIATLFGASMPTRKLSDLTHKHSVLKMTPVTMTPDASMTTVPVFNEHNEKIEEARIPMGESLSALIAGHKKDIVITNRLTEPNKLFIYGWHYPDGTPIQPLSGAHNDQYVDYSHGVRLINKELMVDGKLYTIKEILQDPVLYKLLSDENGIMQKTEYPTREFAAPEKPTTFAVVPVDATSVKILVKSVAGESYFVKYGESVSALNVENELAGNESVISGLTEGNVYYFTLVAENANGRSAASEVLAAVPSEETSALIVNGFDRSMAGNSFDFVKEHGPALMANGMTFASATNDAVIDGLVTLSDYAFVDYILGEESTADKTFNASEQALVKAYLKQGGDLFVSSAEIGWDLGRSNSGAASNAFLKDYLKCSFVADNPGTSSGLYHDARILAETGFGEEFAFAFADGTGTTVAYPDVLKPEDAAVGFLAFEKDGEIYNTANGFAGVGYCGTFPDGTAEGKVVVMSIPFESVSTAEKRNELMKRVLDFDGASSGVETVGTATVRIYPNPASDVATVAFEAEAGECIDIALWASDGRLCSRLNDKAVLTGVNACHLDVSSLAKGIYVCRIAVGEKVEYQKLIVE